MGPQASSKGTMKNVIQGITSPLQLGALLLLITESLCVSLFFKLNPKDSFVINILMIIVLAITIIGLEIPIVPCEKEDRNSRSESCTSICYSGCSGTCKYICNNSYCTGSAI